MSSTTWDGARTTFANGGMSFYHLRHSSFSRAAPVVGAFAWSNFLDRLDKAAFAGAAALDSKTDAVSQPAGRRRPTT
jgi:hypothetical protein